MAKPSGPAASLGSVWRRTVAFGFRLLYNELAWLYDPVSWLTSFGQWQRWQATVHRFLPPRGTVLEVACGPGHLLAELAQQGYQVAGLDLSRAMVRQAQRRLAGQGLPGAVCRSRVQALPFGREAFQAIIATFPTSYVYDPQFLEEAARVLQRKGRLIVVESATLHRNNLPARGLEWLYHITGQRGPAPNLPGLLGTVGLTAHREHLVVGDSTANVVVARKE